MMNNQPHSQTVFSIISAALDAARIRLGLPENLENDLALVYEKEVWAVFDSLDDHSLANVVGFVDETGALHSFLSAMDSAGFVPEDPRHMAFGICLFVVLGMRNFVPFSH